MVDFARFDRRHYPTVPVTEGYREWLPSYDATVEDTMDLALLDRIERVSWPGVERAADLGCGTGRTAAWLRSRGVARIDGVDLTPEMLDAARRRGLHEGVVDDEWIRRKPQWEPHRGWPVSFAWVWEAS